MIFTESRVCLVIGEINDENLHKEERHTLARSNRNFASETFAKIVFKLYHLLELSK